MRAERGACFGPGSLDSDDFSGVSNSVGVELLRDVNYLKQLVKVLYRTGIETPEIRPLHNPSRD